MSLTVWFSLTTAYPPVCSPLSSYLSFPNTPSYLFFPFLSFTPSPRFHLFPLSFSLTVINCLLGRVIHLSVSHTWIHALQHPLTPPLLPSFPSLLHTHAVFPPLSFHPKVSEARWGGAEGNDLPDNSRLYMCAHTHWEAGELCTEALWVPLHRQTQKIKYTNLVHQRMSGVSSSVRKYCMVRCQSWTTRERLQTPALFSMCHM